MWIDKNKVKPKNNISVTQARMTRDSERSPTKFSRLKIILKYLKLYCDYSGLNSLKYLADSHRPWFERIWWIIIHFLIIFTLVFMVYISYLEFVTTPLTTSVETDNQKTTEISFPAIAICSINRISRQSATELATHIFNANITNKSVDEILDLIIYLGNLYSSDFNMDVNRNVEIHELLETYFEGPYDVTGIMKNLSPSCAVMLLKCKLHGTIKNCSQLFDFRKTKDGYCCTFNYVRESDDIRVLNEQAEEINSSLLHLVKDLGIDRGLTVVLDPLLDDYFYSIMPFVGWKVIVFNPADFPDMASGGVTEILAMPLSETFVDVTTTTFVSNQIVKNFPRNERNCIFKSEGDTVYGSTLYTYSDCIVNCKIYHIQRVCGCRPFFYPRRGEKQYSNRICNTLDLTCLNEYKRKWLTIFPHEDSLEIFRVEKSALHCYHCYPDCEDISYDILSWKSYMTVGGYDTNLLWNYNVTDQGILHVYFSKYGTIRLRQDVSFHWYELLSDIGGICGIFIGFSFISIVELLYFFAFVLRDLLYKKSALQEDDDRKDEIPSVQTQTVQAIYWNELQPRSWHSAKYGKFSVNRARY